MNININLSQPMENTSLGKLGEHNATTLVVTDDMPAENITHYRLAFQSGGQATLSEAFASLPITYPLPRALTSYPRISMQLIGYDDDGNLVRKSDKIAKFYFEPSIPNTEIEVDGANHDLAGEIVSMKADIEILDHTTEVLAFDISNKADKGTSYTIDETNALLYLKASREWVQAQGYANADDLAAKQNKLTPGPGISIDGDTISATGGAGGKEPFIGTYGETPYNDIKQAIIDGRQVFLVYDTGSRTTKYIMLQYVGHNKGTKPFDVSADISGYIFRFCGIDGSSTSAGGSYIAYYARINANGTYSAYSNDIVTDRNLVEYDEEADYNDNDILTAYGVLDAIAAALEAFRDTL